MLFYVSMWPLRLMLAEEELSSQGFSFFHTSWASHQHLSPPPSVSLFKISYFIYLIFVSLGGSFCRLSISTSPKKNASESIYRFAASLPAVAAGKPSGNTPARWWNGRRGEAYSSTQWSCQWWMPVRGGLLAPYGKSSLAIQGCTERAYMTPDIKLNWRQSSGFALKNKKCCQEVLPFLSSLHFIFLRLALDGPC